MVIFMHISIEKLNQIEKQYRDFKKTPCYEERKAHLEFADFARAIIEKLVQKDYITNQNLTALIQIFGYGSKIPNVKTYIESLKFDETFSDDIFNKFIDNGLTGFTGIGTTAIYKLTDDELTIVHKFLIDVLKSNSEEAIREAILNFEKETIPQVKYGIYSPWLYYLHPTICPIVVGPVKDYLAKLGRGVNSYLDAWDMLKQIKQAIKEDNYGYLDTLIFHNQCEVFDYWLFIVPTKYEEGKLWKYCKQNSIAAMQYQYGHERTNSVTKNLDSCKQIKIGDRVVVYLNTKTIGGIGEVTRRFFTDKSKDNGFDGIFGQRIGIKWIAENFETSIAPIWNQLSISKNILSSQTIHKITEEDYTKITNYINGGTIMDEQEQSKSNLLSSKKQIILYGPPGTGKTYSARMLATEILTQNKEPVITWPSPPKPPIKDLDITPVRAIGNDTIGKNITVVESMYSVECNDTYQPEYYKKFPGTIHYKRALKMMLGHKRSEINVSEDMINRIPLWFKNYEIIKEWDYDTGDVTITKKGAELLKSNGLISSWSLDPGAVFVTEKGRKY